MLIIADIKISKESEGKNMIHKTLVVTAMALVFSISIYGASIPQRFNELDKEFQVLVKKTDTCISAINYSHQNAKSLDAYKPVMKLKRKNIDGLKQKFNKQLDRYEQRKAKLSEEEQLLTKEYVLKIKDKVKALQKNIHIIFDKKSA